jgi:hypothetical protein
MLKDIVQERKKREMMMMIKYASNQGCWADVLIQCPFQQPLVDVFNGLIHCARAKEKNGIQKGPTRRGPQKPLTHTTKIHSYVIFSARDLYVLSVPSCEMLHTHHGEVTPGR